MKLLLEKFGKTLTSRQLGSEAYKAFQSTLNNIGTDEEIKIDFTGVLTLSPSWADEFLTPLRRRIGDRLVLLPSDNWSVQATVKLLEEIDRHVTDLPPIN